MPIRVCTYNIRFILDRWEERKELLVSELREAEADVYGLQEVNIGGKANGQSIELSKRLIHGKFEHFDSAGFREYLNDIPGLSYIFRNSISMWFYDICAFFNEKCLSSILGKYVQFIYYYPIIGPLVYFCLGSAWIFGSSILFNANTLKRTDNVVCEHFQIGNWRMAQRIIFVKENRRLCIVNIHLSSEADQEEYRLIQMIHILKWVHSTPNIDGYIIMGDFNSIPGSMTYLYLEQQGYYSAYKASMGNEPTITFHQQHEAPTKDISEEKTLDYIFYKGCLDVRLFDKVKVIGTKPSNTDNTIFPSDHYGLVANLYIDP